MKILILEIFQNISLKPQKMPILIPKLALVLQKKNNIFFLLMIISQKENSRKQYPCKRQPNYETQKEIRQTQEEFSVQKRNKLESSHQKCLFCGKKWDLIHILDCKIINHMGRDKKSGLFEWLNPANTTEWKEMANYYLQNPNVQIKTIKANLDKRDQDFTPVLEKYLSEIFKKEMNSSRYIAIRPDL
eukprot:Anaeramoba_ignava/a352502_18.p1 GENE.a352502_18~~a352502_18.p1  ORF type:complete len:188 (+),score=46.89 a352502_18:169-732(+)